MGTYIGSGILNIVMNNLNMSTDNHEFICGEFTYPVEVINYDDDVEWSTNQNLGNSTADARMLIVIVQGDLVIDTNVIIIPQTRKRGFLIYVTGTLTNNGTISMTARGASAPNQIVYLWAHNNRNLELIEGSTLGGVNNVTTAHNGVVGGHGSNRRCGGGGSGGRNANGNVPGTTAKGGNSTSYSGGTGGAGLYGAGTVASDTGGVGGSSTGSDGGGAGGGGVGNPGGTGGLPAANGANGTGGLLIIYAKTFINAGSLLSQGISNNTYTNAAVRCGGSSGGGSINLFYSDIIYNVGVCNVNGGPAGATGAGVSNISGAGGNGSLTTTQIEPYLFGDLDFRRLHVSGRSLIHTITENLYLVTTGNSFLNFNGDLIHSAETIVYEGNHVWSEDKLLGQNISDHRMLIVIVKGNLRIDPGVTIKSTATRRAFLLFVLGNLENYGTINMTTSGQILGGIIKVFQNNNESYETVGLAQKNGIALISTVRLINKGDIYMKGDTLQLYYQGLLELGTTEFRKIDGNKNSLMANRIVDADEVETRTFV